MLDSNDLQETRVTSTTVVPNAELEARRRRRDAENAMKATIDGALASAFLGPVLVWGVWFGLMSRYWFGWRQW